MRRTFNQENSFMTAFHKFFGEKVHPENVVAVCQVAMKAGSTQPSVNQNHRDCPVQLQNQCIVFPQLLRTRASACMPARDFKYFSSASLLLLLLQTIKL